MKLSRSLEVAVGMVLGQLIAAVLAHFMAAFLAKRHANKTISMLQEMQELNLLAPEESENQPEAARGGPYL